MEKYIYIKKIYIYTHKNKYAYKQIYIFEYV
jgi:hypothetical protein